MRELVFSYLVKLKMKCTGVFVKGQEKISMEIVVHIDLVNPILYPAGSWNSPRLSEIVRMVEEVGLFVAMTRRAP